MFPGKFKIIHLCYNPILFHSVQKLTIVDYHKDKTPKNTIYQCGVGLSLVTLFILIFVFAHIKYFSKISL